MPLQQLCRVITVDGGELPLGHEWVIVRHPDDGVVVYAKADDRAQLEARAAYLAWDRLRATPEPSRLGGVN